VISAVRHQTIWDRWRRDLAEALAHLVGDLKRLCFGTASGGSRLSFV
jgi:hypothetical protein